MGMSETHRVMDPGGPDEGKMLKLRTTRVFTGSMLTAAALTAALLSGGGLHRPIPHIRHRTRTRSTRKQLPRGGPPARRSPCAGPPLT